MIQKRVRMLHTYFSHEVFMISNSNVWVGHDELMSTTFTIPHRQRRQKWRKTWHWGWQEGQGWEVAEKISPFWLWVPAAQGGGHAGSKPGGHGPGRRRKVRLSKGPWLPHPVSHLSEVVLPTVAQQVRSWPQQIIHLHNAHHGNQMCQETRRYDHHPAFATKISFSFYALRIRFGWGPV